MTTLNDAPRNDARGVESGTTVYVVAYEWADYGHGVDGVFINLDDAKRHVETNPDWGTPWQLLYTDDRTIWQYVDDNEDNWYSITATHIR